LDVSLFEGDPVAVAYSRVAQLPLDGIERMDPRGREVTTDRQPVACLDCLSWCCLRGAVHRRASWFKGRENPLFAAEISGYGGNTRSSASGRTDFSRTGRAKARRPNPRIAAANAASERPSRSRARSRAHRAGCSERREIALVPEPPPVGEFGPRGRRAIAGLVHGMPRRQPPVGLEGAPPGH